MSAKFLMGSFSGETGEFGMADRKERERERIN